MWASTYAKSSSNLLPAQPNAGIDMQFQGGPLSYPGSQAHRAQGLLPVP